MLKSEDYNELVKQLETENEDEKEQVIIKLNQEHSVSIVQLAKLDKSSPYLIRKIFFKHNVEPTSASVIARKQMLEMENHPTRGRQRTEEEKIKMGVGLSKSWTDMTDNRKQQIEDQKERLSKEPGKMKQMSLKGSKAMRKAAEEGSRLEHYIREKLFENGYVSVQHRDKILPNEKFEFDLFIKDMGVIIEVDGPTHFEPIFGDHALNKSLSRDQLKTKLSIEQGYKMVRVKQLKAYSQHYFRTVFEELLKLLTDIRGGLKGSFFSIEVK